MSAAWINKHVSKPDSWRIVLWKMCLHCALLCFPWKNCLLHPFMVGHLNVGIQAIDSHRYTSAQRGLIYYIRCKLIFYRNSIHHITICHMAFHWLCVFFVCFDFHWPIKLRHIILIKQLSILQLTSVCWWQTTRIAACICNFILESVKMIACSNIHLPLSPIRLRERMLSIVFFL